MLVFLKQQYLEQVRAGRKTSTIRPWPRCHLKPGSSISFNGRLRVVCAGVERARLADLSLSDIRSDGFKSREDFMRAFHALYPAATTDTAVWVIRFALTDSAHSARA